MWNNRENNSASSRKRRLSDGNEAAAQATISGGTTPIGFKRWRRSGHDAPDQQAGSNDIGSTSSEAIEGRTSAHPTGDENSLALINDPLQVTTNQRRNVLQATCAIAIDALKIVKDVAEAVPVAGNPLKATCGVIIDMLELIRESDAVHEGWKELVQIIADASDVAGKVLKWSRDHPEWHQNVRDQIIKYMRKLDEIRYELSDHFSDPADHSRTLKSLWHNFTHAAKEAALRKISDAKIKGFKDDLNVIRLDLANVLTLQTAATASEILAATSEIAAATSEIANNVQHLHSELKDQEVDALLRSITTATMANGDIHQTCARGTRGFILDDIRRWINDDAAPQIFLLIDAAGYGKSTIAKQMTAELDATGRLLGRFFFSRSAEETRTTKYFFSTLAQQGICQFDPSLRLIVAAGIKKLIDPVSAPLEKQFQGLFITPLEDMSRPGVLILDALDECEPSLWDSAQSPLTRILSCLPNIPNMKVFITSRPDSELVSCLMNSRHARQVISSTPNIGNNKSDIETFLTSTLGNKFKSDDVMALANQADGLFIWAATAAKMLLRPGLPQQRKLDILLSPQYKELDVLYKDVMETAISQYEVEDATKILEIIAIATQPLSPTSIDQLLEHPGSFYLIQRMASVLLCETVNDPVRFLHPTFLEFLFQTKRSGRYAIDSHLAHRSMTKCTLRTLHKELKYDICQITRSSSPFPMNTDTPHLDELVQKWVSIPLQYSSLHWIAHAMNVLGNNDVLKDMLDFFREKLLNWIEIIGLMNSLVPCIADIGQLLDIMRNRAVNTSPTDVQWAEDIFDFLRTNQTLLTVSTMHVYTSALMWRPLSSPIRNQYLTAGSASYIPHIKVGLELDSRPANRLVGHIGPVMDIMPHPNDQYILSLSTGEEGGLQLIQWDIKTCTKAWEKIWPVPYNKDPKTQMVYSPDKTHILVGCNCEVVVYLRLENMGLTEIWSNYSLRLTTLAILPAGDQAIYAYNTDPKDSPSAKTLTCIGTLNLLSQESIRWIVLGKDQYMESMCICKTGPFFATISRIDILKGDTHEQGLHRRRIIAWNMNKDVVPSLRYSWASKNRSITFLPQSTKLLSIGHGNNSHDNWCIWDVETGNQVFSGSRKLGVPMRTLDRDRLLLLDHDSILLIDLHTSEETKRPINAIFDTHAPNTSCWIESRSTLFWKDKNQIKMSKIEGERLQELPMNPDPVALLSFIDSGRMLLAATNHSVRVWSTDSGEELKLVETKADPIEFVAFSVRRSHVIVTMPGPRVQIWDISHSDLVSREVYAYQNGSNMRTNHYMGGFHWIALHPTLDIFATGCSCSFTTVQLTLREFKPDSTLSLRKISIDTSLQTCTRLCLSFHPDGRYLCWRQNALDISVDPPVAVDAVALPRVLAEASETASTPTLINYRKGDHGICWIDFGVPTRHSFALPLDFTLINGEFRLKGGFNASGGLAFKDNVIALGGKDGRVIVADFSNLIEETDLSGPSWNYKFEKGKHLFVMSTSLE